MRLWSIHPSYLDTKGLLAAWREGLLAYHVLSGRTKGYTSHPQLSRFRAHEKPLEAIVCFLHAIVDEADRRGYHFDRSKLPPITTVPQIPVTRGQLRYETFHLKNKLQVRNPELYKNIEKIECLECHPLFIVIDGEIEQWEKV